MDNNMNDKLKKAKELGDKYGFYLINEAHPPKKMREDMMDILEDITQDSGDENDDLKEMRYKEDSEDGYNEYIKENIPKISELYNVRLIQLIKLYIEIMDKPDALISVNEKHIVTRLKKEIKNLIIKQLILFKAREQEIEIPRAKVLFEMDKDEIRETILKKLSPIKEMSEANRENITQIEKAWTEQEYYYFEYKARI